MHNEREIYIYRTGTNLECKFDSFNLFDLFNCLFFGGGQCVKKKTHSGLGRERENKKKKIALEFGQREESMVRARLFI